ncbi:flavin-containing monooxygenase [Kocuria sp. M4R2S49]|uniref:flavin-containing monooxygenase n=1 Tax=Kocuria rhizosphaericola TaxID=3376284 RepID=UPI0037A319D9
MTCSVIAVSSSLSAASSSTRMASMRPVRELDVVVVGAGFSGLYLLHRLRGQGLSVVVEKGDGVGGTWYWNRYPGARCDVESPYYSYSFSPELEQEWEWTERYPTQPEILRYLNHVADRFDLRRDIALDTEVVSAVYDEPSARWTVTTRSTVDGSEQTVSARYCVMATGCLSAGRVPDFEGVDFSGKRVAVIGTGSSGIQSIPEIARHAEHLTVFQRTPNFSVPARNQPLDPQEWARIKAEYPRLRELARQTPTGLPFPPSTASALETAPEEQRKVMEEHWTLGGFRLGQCFSDLAVSKEANDVVAQYIRERIDEIVDDPAVAELLKPHDHPVGTKRICVDTDYYATFNRDNVTLVDVRPAPISKLTEHGLSTADREYEFDALVFATGFDAMTGALTRIDITGTDGTTLAEKTPRT